MDQSEMETLIRNVDSRTRRIEERTTRIEERTTRIEQILPTLVTKEDAKAFATKDDLREESERTRRHFDTVAEQMKADIALIAEGHKATDSRLNRTDPQRPV
jgi:uncharacterized protein YicC (UPF0701 family)